VFHDPRSLTLGVESKACLHAKCVVVDQERVLVTSANFTEAAHERNIEAGVLLNDPVTAIALQMQFESLVTRNLLFASFSIARIKRSQKNETQKPHFNL
jgi:phosphatidylserine/phosphatidylglycerophosphate/cardiolipin synthase-like enzyme